MMVRLRQYWIQLTADRRKCAMLCTVFGVGLLLWARLIVVSNMPKTAMAEPEKTDHAPGRTPISGRTSEKGILKEFFPEPAKSSMQDAEDCELTEAWQLRQLREMVDEYSLDAVMNGASLAVINGRTYRTGDQVEALRDADTRFILTEVRPTAVTLEFEGRRFELKMSAPGG